MGSEMCIRDSSTFAVPNAYGEYIFTYTTCGEDFTTNVSIQSIEPIINSDSETYYCLDSFQLDHHSTAYLLRANLQVLMHPQFLKV